MEVEFENYFVTVEYVVINNDKNNKKNSRISSSVSSNSNNSYNNDNNNNNGSNNNNSSNNNSNDNNNNSNNDNNDASRLQSFKIPRFVPPSHVPLAIKENVEMVVESSEERSE